MSAALRFTRGAAIRARRVSPRLASRAASRTPSYASKTHRRGSLSKTQPHEPAAGRIGRRTAATRASRRAAASAAGGEQQLLLFRVRGDGNCLFRALAQGFHLQSKGLRVERVLSRGEETAAAAELRAKVIKELQDRRSDIEPFIDQDYDVYLSRMARDGTWGGEPELVAAAHAMQMPVRVYTFTGSQIQLVNEYGAEYMAFGEAAVSVFFHGMGHYDLLAAP